MEEEKFEAFEDDVDLENAKYQVWFLCYNRDDEFVSEHLIAEYDDPDPARAKAYDCLDELVGNPKRLFTKYIEENDDIAYVNILVETTVEVEGEDMDRNVATYFDEYVNIKNN